MLGHRELDLLAPAILFLLPGVPEAETLFAPRELAGLADTLSLFSGPLENAGGLVLRAFFLSQLSPSFQRSRQPMTSWSWLSVRWSGGGSLILSIIALVALIGVGLINYVVKMLPTGLEAKPKEKSPEGIRALFYGIEKNNLVYAQKVLSMNFDPNLHHENGFTPLAYAAMKGSVPMLDLLLRNGADPAQLTKEGDTPVELALRMGHAEAADLLKRARMTAAAEAPVAAAQPAPQSAG